MFNVQDPSGLIEGFGAVDTNSTGTLVQSATSANTKGSWVSLGTTTFDWQSFYLNILPTDHHDPTLFDIGIRSGGAGTEEIIMANMGVQANQRAVVGQFLPLSVPKGYEICLRCQEDTAPARSFYCSVDGMGAGWIGRQGFQKCITYGADTANSQGTSLTKPGSVDTEAAWTQIEASTDQDLRALGVYIGNDNDVSRVTANYHIDIAMGAAASEVVIIPDIVTYSWAAIDYIAPAVIFCFPIFIPKATRLAARYQTDDLTDSLDVMLYGFH